MAFTYDTTTARGRVRLLLADTDTSDATKQMFTDAEVDAFLALESNEVYGAAAAACESLAASAARSAVRYKAERLLEIDRKDIPAHFRALAKTYRDRLMAEPTEHIDAYDVAFDELGGDRSEYVGDPY